MSLAMERKLTKSTTLFLSSSDARDKLLKGLGNLMKLFFVLTGEEKYMKTSKSMSEARSLMRLLGWTSNVTKVSTTLSKTQPGVRDLIFLLRVVGDGVFCITDNVYYVGKYFPLDSQLLNSLSHTSVLGLMWGYVGAVLLDLYDITASKKVPRRRWFILFRNICDLLTAISNSRSFPALEMSFPLVSSLGLASAAIATVENYSDALDATS